MATGIIIGILWLVIGVILGYRREEKNAKMKISLKYKWLGIVAGMFETIIACPFVLVFAIVREVFMRPWD